MQKLVQGSDHLLKKLIFEKPVLETSTRRPHFKSWIRVCSRATKPCSQWYVRKNECLYTGGSRISHFLHSLHLVLCPQAQGWSLQVLSAVESPCWEWKWQETKCFMETMVANTHLRGSRNFSGVTQMHYSKDAWTESGVAEWINRTLVKMVRSMLIDSKLPKF